MTVIPGEDRTTLKAPAQGTFRALRSRNYRLWAVGSVVSNVGTWMQRIAQDWVVLTQLTHHSATAVGIVMALQAAPVLLLLPLTGFVIDHFDRRKLLIVTQLGLGLLALALGLLIVTGLVQLWHVYVFAFLFGCVSAFDAPANQTFVGDLVGEADLANAVSLNSTSFNVARMIGPALAGLLIGAVGSGWAFLINGASFAAVLCSLSLLRVSELHLRAPATRGRGSFVEGFRYVWQRPDIKLVLFMIFAICAFGLNFPIFISTMSVSVFHAGAGQYGLLMSLMSVGSLAGAFLTARQREPHITHLLAGAAVFGLGFTLAATAPSYWFFGLTLAIIGVSAVAFTTSTSSFTQLSTEPAMRGRVMALRLAVAMAATLVGAPIVGWVADAFGPRWGGGVAALSGFAAALGALYYLVSHRHLRVAIERGRLRFRMENDAPTTVARSTRALHTP